jgi:hypothetical protein
LKINYPLHYVTFFNKQRFALVSLL